ncbi:MAG: RNA polymerase sigma factor [Bacteroidaceae bacterium]|nr:RNA polymerase sigma factor [Bacteroidaceae bacterium]
MIQIEEDIVIRCQRGDKEAFRLVVQTHQRMVFSVALKMLCDEEEAKDIVQETFIRAWQSLSAYDVRKTFSTWLYTIATRLCLDRLKSMRHTVPLPEDESTLRRFASDVDHQRALENREWVSIVRVLADRLSPKQRLVFTLCQLEGLPSSEVETITGMDAKQVKSNLYVARQTIRERLKQLGYDTDR